MPLTILNSSNNVALQNIPSSNTSSHVPNISASSRPTNLAHTPYVQPTHSMTTRLQHGIQTPIQKLNLNVQLASIIDIPKTITQALKYTVWCHTMEIEMAALNRNKT